MFRIFKYEFKAFSKSKNLRNYIIAIILSAVFYIVVSMANNQVISGLVGFTDSAINQNSVLVLVLPIFAGILISANFEERLFQNLIMSGKTRLEIILGKYLFFIVLMFGFILIPVLISTGFYSVTKGWNSVGMDINTTDIVFRTLIYMFLSVIAYSIVFPIAIGIKKTGGTIGLGLLICMVLNGISTPLMAKDKIKDVFSLTPLGAGLKLFMDNSNMLFALFIAIIWSLIIAIISFAIIKDSELK